MTRPDFTNAFREGWTTELEDLGPVSFTCRLIGELTVTTGQVIACDPLVFSEFATPFATAIDPGRYPVILSVANIGGEQRVAYAKLQVRPRLASRWEAALRSNHATGPVAEGEILGYPVESGTGCFMDKEAADWFLAQLDYDIDFDRHLMEQINRNYVHTWDWANMPLSPKSGANLIAFSSGWGTGCYASYFGYDRDGNMVDLTTDFRLLHETELPRGI
jgi:hypothetical protein